MSVLLVLSLILLFLLVKAYFSNSYMYAIQDNVENKNSNNIGAMIDTRYDQFNNRKPNPNNKLNYSVSNYLKQQPSILEKALLNNKPSSNVNANTNKSNSD